MSHSSSPPLRKGDMTEGPVLSALILFTIPTLLTNILQQLYNMADSVIVGQFCGAEALAAVGANSFLSMLLASLFVGAGIGGGVLVSQQFGARKFGDITKTFNTMYCLIALMSAIVGIVGIFIAEPLMKVMDTPDNIIDDAILYFRIYCAALPGLAVYSAGSAGLRSVGDAKAPLFFLIFSAVCNVVLNIVFVVAFHMGVAGVAWATFIAEYLSAILVLFRTGTSKFCKITINLNSLRIDWETAKVVMKLGIPSSIQMAVSSIGNVLCQRYCNQFGSNAVAAITSAMRLDGFIMMPAQAISMAMSVFIGQNLAAKKTERLHTGTRFGVILCVVLSVALSVVLFLIARPAMRLFTSEAEVISLGATMLRIGCMFYWAMALQNAFAGILRGAGDTLSVMVISTIGAVLRVPLTWLLAIRPVPHVFTGYCYAASISQIIMAILAVCYYLTGRWKNKTVVTIDS